MQQGRRKKKKKVPYVEGSKIPIISDVLYYPLHITLNIAVYYGGYIEKVLNFLFVPVMTHFPWFNFLLPFVATWAMQGNNMFWYWNRFKLRNMIAGANPYGDWTSNHPNFYDPDYVYPERDAPINRNANDYDLGSYHGDGYEADYRFPYYETSEPVLLDSFETHWLQLFGDVKKHVFRWINPELWNPLPPKRYYPIMREYDCLPYEFDESEWGTALVMKAEADDDEESVFNPL